MNVELRMAMLVLGGACALIIFGGCITGQRFNPAATQPATVVDRATTQPWYYLRQSASAQVEAGDFEKLVAACEGVARDYLFTIDRVDYRAGVITTEPMVSKQPMEFWRSDAGTSDDVWRSAVTTIRRTVRFEIARGDAGRFHMTPKVLVEQESLREHRITSPAEYRHVFSAGQGPQTASQLADSNGIPADYWTPIARDRVLEVAIAAAVEKRLGKN